MNKVISILTVLISVLSYAQEDTVKIEKNQERSFPVIEKSAMFPGGYGKLNEFIKNELRYPAQAVKKHINGIVHVKFVITKEGKIESPEIIKSVSPEIDEEAIRIILKMPNWIPGESKNGAANCWFIVPVKF